MQCVAQALNLHLSYKNRNKRFDLTFNYLCVPGVQIKSNGLGRRNSEAGEKKGGNKGGNPALGVYPFPLGAPVGTGRLRAASHQAVPVG